MVDDARKIKKKEKLILSNESYFENLILIQNSCGLKGIYLIPNKKSSRMLGKKWESEMHAARSFYLSFS